VSTLLEKEEDEAGEEAGKKKREKEYFNTKDRSRIQLGFL